MSELDFDAIYKAYAGVVTTIDEGTGAYDKDGKPLPDCKVLKASITFCNFVLTCRPVPLSTVKAVPPTLSR